MSAVPGAPRVPRRYRRSRPRGARRTARMDRRVLRPRYCRSPGAHQGGRQPGEAVGAQAISTSEADKLIPRPSPDGYHKPAAWDDSFLERLITGQSCCPIPWQFMCIYNRSMYLIICRGELQRRPRRDGNLFVRRVCEPHRMSDPADRFPRNAPIGSREPEQQERRRPGRRAWVSPTLIPLLRFSPTPEQVEAARQAGFLLDED